MKKKYLHYNEGYIVKVPYDDNTIYVYCRAFLDLEIMLHKCTSS